MTIDTIETLKALKHYGLRVARSKFVDSADDAIAFAERRAAKDPRLMPILLRGARSTHAPLRTKEAIRQAYERLVRTAGEGKIIAQTVTDPGTDVTIDGRTDEIKGKLIALRSAIHGVERMTPLDLAGAEVLALNFQSDHHHGASERAHRMLERLLIRASTFFEDSGVTEFHLAVRLHENSYTVLDGSMKSPTAMRFKERLDPRAHDRRSDGYHPAGHQ